MQETLYDIIIDDCLLILKVTDRILNTPKDITFSDVEDLKTEIKLINNITAKMSEILDKASVQLSAQNPTAQKTALPSAPAQSTPQPSTLK